jgi:hypothetical protein
MALQIRRGTDAERTAGGGVVFANGELVYVTDTDKLYIGDGATAGGMPMAGSAIASIGEYIVADTINSTLDLQQNLDLNGKDIIGTGNINIAGTITATGNINLGDDASADTVNLAAQITSSLTPNADSTYNIGTQTARWNNGYFTGLVVDGQVDAVAVNANVVADDSSVMVNVSNNIFTGAFAGNVTGNVLGDLTGDSAGTHTGAVVGNVTGDVVGNVTGDTAGTHTGAVVGDVTGDIVGNVTGDVTGDVKGSGAQTVLAANTGPSDAALSVSTVTATTLSGTLTGNVTGNTAGYHTGDVKGSIFGDDSTVIVDAVNNTLIGNVTGDLTGNVTGDTAGTHTGAVVGNAAGDHTGTFTGNVFTALIDSADSSAITVTPAVVMSSDLTVDNAVSIGGITGVVINDNNIDAYSASNPTKLAINSICADANDYTTELVIDSNVNVTNDMTVTGKLQAFGERAITAIHRTALSETNSGFFVTEYAGSVTDPAELQDISNYTIKTKIVEDVADFGTAVKFASMTTTQRNALTAAAGMVVFNTTDTKLQVYTGSAWADLH